MNEQSQYKAIAAVADLLGVKQHVIRFWERHFPTAKPSKIINKRRYYTPADIAQLQYIKGELYERGLTIAGLQKQYQAGGKRDKNSTLQSTEQNTHQPSGTDLPTQQKLLDLCKLVHVLRSEMQADIKGFSVLN